MNEFALPTAKTKLVAVIGDPVRHSLSPVMFNSAFRALGMDWLYVALPVKLGSSRAAIDGIRALDIVGLSVTTPHKETVAAAVDQLSPVATIAPCNLRLQKKSEFDSTSSAEKMYDVNCYPRLFLAPG